MRDLLKPIVEFFIELLEMFPYLTGIISLLIIIYCLKYSLPKAYNGDKESLYVYWNTLGLIVVIIFLFVTIFFIQLFRIL
jgi:hypothetical protein